MVDSPYSANVEVEQSQSQKEVTINNATIRLAAMIAATHAFTATGTVTPTSANPTPQWQANLRFTLAGTPGAFDFDVPSGANFCKLFMVENNTNGVATVQVTGGGGANVDVQIGQSAWLYSDGTDVTGVITGGLGHIPLSLESLREIGLDTADQIPNLGANEGGHLTADTTPAYIRVNLATDKAIRVNWVLSNVDEVQFPPVFMPPDLDATKDATIHFLARMSGGTDTTTAIDVQVFDGIGDTEMGGLTADLTSTLAEHIRTIVAADITGHPLGVLNIALVPEAHGTDALELYAAWIEYQKVIV